MRTSLAALALAATLATLAEADTHDKKTIFTFASPVEVPGGVILQPGKYVFKLVDSNSNRNIVRVTNDREDRVLATILAIPNYRMDVTDKTQLQFYEMPRQPQAALRAWFYPGDNYGQEFAYPKKRASEIAKLTRRDVPTAPEAENLNNSYVPSAPVELAQNRTPASPSANAAQAPAQPADPADPADSAMPRTASPITLIGLGGLACLGIAFTLRRRHART